MTKADPNEGIRKVSWILVATLVVLIVLGAVFWWYDGYIIHELQEALRARR